VMVKKRSSDYAGPCAMAKGCMTSQDGVREKKKTRKCLEDRRCMRGGGGVWVGACVFLLARWGGGGGAWNSRGAGGSRLLIEVVLVGGGTS